MATRGSSKLRAPSALEGACDVTFRTVTRYSAVLSAVRVRGFEFFIKAHKPWVSWILDEEEMKLLQKQW